MAKKKPLLDDSHVVAGLTARSYRSTRKLRLAAEWFLNQLDDIAFYSGTTAKTWEKLVRDMEKRLKDAAGL